MKTWKHFMTIFIIFNVVFGFTSCATGSNIKHTHDWGDWSITTLPTETTSGIETRICKNDPSHIETQNLTLTGFQNYFFGTWSNNDVVIMISNSEISYDGQLHWPDCTFTITNANQILTINNHNDTMEVYPVGITISGPLIQKNVTENFTFIGEIGDTESFDLFYNNSDQTKIGFRLSSIGSVSVSVFTKQQ